MDRARYQALFVEEATDHVAEMGRALLALEKDPGSTDALEICFRMAHSIKGMAASMGYQPITERAHRLEDRLSAARAAGRVESQAELPAWFAEMDQLERMIGQVRDTGACTTAPPAHLDEADASGLKKKLLRPTHRI